MALIKLPHAETFACPQAKQYTRATRGYASRIKRHINLLKGRQQHNVNKNTSS